MDKQELLNKRLQSAFELAAGCAGVKGYKIGNVTLKHKIREATLEEAGRSKK